MTCVLKYNLVFFYLFTGNSKNIERAQFFPSVLCSTEQRHLLLNRTPAMERSARKSLWHDSVQCLQDQRGEDQEMPEALQSHPSIPLYV